MSTFIMLCKFEREGLAALVKEGKDLERRAKELAQEFDNTKITDLLLTTGRYDLVAIVDAPSIDDAVSFLLALNIIGECITETLSAVGNLTKVLKAASDAHTKMEGRG